MKSDLFGPDAPPEARGDEWDVEAQIIINRAAPAYMFTDGRCVVHVLGRLRIEIAAALRRVAKQ